MKFIPVLFIALVLFSFPQSCTRVVTKNIEVTDSTAIKSLEDSLALHKKINDELSSELTLAQLAGVKFDTLYVPGDTIVNTVTIREDGEITAKGRIKSATISKDLTYKIISKKQETIDSLKNALSEEKKNVKVVEKQIEKKTKVFVGWWLLIIGFVGGVYARVRYKDFFTKTI